MNTTNLCGQSQCDSVNTFRGMGASENSKALPLLVDKIGLVQKDNIGVLELTPHRDQQVCSSFSCHPTTARPSRFFLLLKLVEQ